MGLIDNQPSQPTLDAAGTGEILNNVKRLSIGDGSLRMERGAMIISDESGTDRVLIGFGEGLF